MSYKTRYGFTLYKPKKSKKWHNKIQVCRRRITKAFTCNAIQSSDLCKKWREEVTKKYKQRWDNSLTWEWFKGEWEYQHTQTRKPLRPRTVEEYKQSFKRFENFARPHYLLDIDFDLLLKFKGRLVEDAIRQKNDFYGVNKILLCIKGAFKWAKGLGYIKIPELSSLALCDVVDVNVDTFTPEQVALMVKYARPKWRLAILLAYGSGCRGEEVYNMPISFLDIKNGFGDVKKRAKGEIPGLDAYSPKCAKDRQIILADDFIAEYLRQKPKGPLLITNAEGEPFTDKTFSKSWTLELSFINNEILREEGNVPPIVGTFKMFRKTFCTYTQAQGADLEEVSKSLGHADTAVTLKNYTDSKNELLRAKERSKLLELKKYLVALPKV